MASSDWREQYDRMKRRFDRIQKWEDGQPAGSDFDAEEFKDNTISFFMDCYHLKDWVKNDDSINIGGEIESEFINKNDEMKVCADIANGIKHLELHSPRSTEDPSLQDGVDITLYLGDSSGIDVSMDIEMNSGELNVFDFGRECISLWEAYLPLKEK